MQVTRSIQASTQNTSMLNIHGKALLHNLDFWLLFSIYSMRFFFPTNVSLHGQSLGLVLHVGLESSYNICWYYYTAFCLDINNVGSMSQSLYAYNNPRYDDAQALRWQAAQVSAISFTIFGGGILIGVIHVSFSLSFCLNFLIAQASSRTSLRAYIERPALILSF